MAEEQDPASGDAVMARAGQAVMLHRAGDREEARNRFLELWDEVGESGDPLHRCTIAHYLADTQDDPADELDWDLRALEAAATLTDRPAAGEDRSQAVRAFYPALHLNLAADYVRLGKEAEARAHLTASRAAFGALSEDAHGAGIRSAVDRLERQLQAGSPSSRGPAGPPHPRPA
ncbi:HPF/RaiA family ribosome-associated protein [Streptomyces triticagri]|uniref:HPF/RaiA family ribosome-associated protein n=1 Tax=Streptomyces triticagri TaxID=2293568 RepID=A0A372M4Y0_9ACTN|nr:HPF/RaiA family ribosome-associated protein [Streptomyces triticagri]RFU85357.1 HPF/RaiA family ribosome-associated protein [Streptomyces triticagri]